MALNEVLKLHVYILISDLQVKITHVLNVSADFISCPNAKDTTRLLQSPYVLKYEAISNVQRGV